MKLPLNIPLPARIHRRLLLLLGGAHALAWGCLWPLDMPGFIKLAAAVLLAASLGYQWRRHIHPSVCHLCLERDGRLMVTNRQGATHEARVLPDTTVHPWLTVLWLQVLGDGRHVLTLLPGSLPEDDFRRLRVWLRWRADVGEDGGVEWE